jgi:hypothetical protein
MMPEAFKQEIKEYLGLLLPPEGESPEVKDDEYIGQEFNQHEQEDMMA